MLPLADSLVHVPQDTFDLKMVEVYHFPMDKYTVGQTVREFSEDDLKFFQGQPLGDFLQQRTGLFVRQYGPGMVASLTMRGTSAGHNAVFWNGLPINSPSLGQADFSVLPVGGFDEASIHYGSGGALYGTDAIGGAVHLTNKLKFDHGHEVQLNSMVGSFGRRNNLLQHSYSDKFFSSRTRMYRNFSRNDYTYTNLSKIGTPLERQQHARVSQWGAMQDLAWNVDEKTQFSTSFWWNLTDRQIQPVIGSTTRDLQQDQNLRWVADIYRFNKDMVWNLKAGWVYDELTFNQNNPSHIHSFLLAGELDWELTSKWKSRTGARFTYIDGNLGNYHENDQRMELYQSTGFHPNEKVGISFNLRQLVYGDNWAPFTPSLGMDWCLWENPIHQIKLNTAFSRSFKVPTLNDRFWIPGGNPELEPEKSHSGEAGIKHVFSKGGFTLINQGTYYHMEVENWILWLPKESFWSPQNIQRVQNSGMEYFMEASMKMQQWIAVLNGNYAWNRAINRTKWNENDRSVGNQLPYTPEHKFQFTATLSKKAFTAFLNTHWVGERFVGTDNSMQLDPYQLWDLGCSYEWILRKSLRGNLGIQINNLLDQNYQVLRLRPMPGRNYQINLNIQL